MRRLSSSRVEASTQWRSSSTRHTGCRSASFSSHASFHRFHPLWRPRNHCATTISIAGSGEIALLPVDVTKVLIQSLELRILATFYSMAAKVMTALLLLLAALQTKFLAILAMIQSLRTHQAALWIQSSVAMVRWIFFISCAR